MPKKDNDLSSAFSRFILKVVTVLSVFFALALTAVLFKQETLRSLEGYAWFPYVKGVSMLVVAFVTAWVCITLFFRKTLTSGAESRYSTRYTGTNNTLNRLTSVLAPLLGIAALISLLCWAVVGWLHELRATGQTVSSHWVQTAPAESSSGAFVTTVTSAPTVTWVATNDYGLRLVQFVTNFTITPQVKTVAVKMEVRSNGANTRGDITWGGQTLTQSNLVVYLNGLEIPSGYTPSRTLEIGYYQFQARYSNEVMWVAVGKK